MRKAKVLSFANALAVKQGADKDYLLQCNGQRQARALCAKMGEKYLRSTVAMLLGCTRHDLEHLSRRDVESRYALLYAAWRSEDDDVALKNYAGAGDYVAPPEHKGSLPPWGY